MQVKKLSLTFFLARRRTNIKQLLKAENITSTQQLQQWCHGHGLELTDDIDVHSLFPVREIHTKTVEPSCVVLEAPVIESTVVVEAVEKTEDIVDVLSAVTALTDEDEPVVEAPKKPRNRKPKVEEIEDNQ
jgi:hypothetical protein